MNGKMARLLKRAAGITRDLKTGRVERATYEPLRMHHFAEWPTYEQYTRTVREMGPPVKGKPNTRERMLSGLPRTVFRTGPLRHVVSREVTKTKYKPGRLPAGFPLLNADGTPQATLAPVGAPVRLKQGSPRAVYQHLKRLHNTIGLAGAVAALTPEAA